MARFIKNRDLIKGQVPGSIVFQGEQKMENIEITLIQYSADSIFENNVDNIQQAFEKIENGMVNWINIYGLHDLELIKEIGKKHNISSLLLENILNTDQRPKYFEGEEYDLFILKMLHEDATTNQLISEQVSIVLTEQFVLTIQEKPGDVFRFVRERIRNKKGRIRNKDNSYLTYALLDAIFDGYSTAIEEIGLEIEEMDSRIFESNDKSIAEELYNFKTELNFLRKTIRPVKDFVGKLLKSENSFFDVSLENYLKDLNEMLIHSTEAIELYNGLVSDQLNIYNTNVSNRMNEVMKVLTIFASIFIPLTFLAGIYGMNFEYIPELSFKYSYLIFWIIVIITFIILVSYFRRKKWF